MPDFNAAQQKILNHRKGNLLVSAGAGSGKTTILTERIVQLITKSHVPLERFLVLTFTNAAAQEMKHRVRKKLLESETHKALASAVDASAIMTFDAFALNLVKTHSFILGVDRDIAIYDETLLKVEKRLLLNQIFDALASKEDPGFQRLIGQFVVKDDRELIDFILLIDDKADLTENKKVFLETYLERFFSETHYREAYRDFLNHIHRVLEELLKQTRAIDHPEDQDKIVDVLETLNRFTSLDEFIDGMKAFEKFPKAPNGLDPESANIRKAIKKELDKLIDLAEMESEAAVKETYLDSKPYVDILLRIIAELNRQLDQKKRSMNRYSFADIAKMATALIDRPGMRDTIAQAFDYIMIDEYQDTNDLQETFIRKLAKDNLMMVGDIKQSIYRFRNANSDIFRQKLKSYRPYDDAKGIEPRSIILAENYRSRPEVIDGINSLFVHLMTDFYGGVDYRSGQMLQLGKKDYLTLVDRHVSYGVHALQYEKVDGEDNAKQEANLILDHILEHLKRGTSVADTKDNRSYLRPIEYRDFAILIDRKTKFDDFVKAFSDRGVPLRVAAEQSLSDSDLFRVVKNISIILARFQGQDISDIKQPVLSVLRSFLFEESDERLYQLMKHQIGFAAFEAFAIFRKLVHDRTTLPLGELVGRIFSDFSFETKMLKIDDVALNRGRMLRLIALAKDLEAQRYGLEGWVAFIENAEAMDLDLTIGEDKANENAVALMTIHKAKGLEFPIVYIPGIASKFNIRELSTKFLYDNHYGIALPMPDKPYPFSLFRYLIKTKGKDEALSEYIRLFYVALTRAKEQLVLVGPSETKHVLGTSFSFSFKDFLTLHLNPAIQQATVSPRDLKPLAKDEPKPAVTMTFGRIDVPRTLRPEAQGDKVFAKPADQAMLDYGTTLHQLLFLVDFKTKDTRFIRNPKDRQLIDKVLALPIIQTLKGEGFKEYAFIDPTTEKIGIIDALWVDGKTAIILDYKTDDIENPSYRDQLARYRNFLTTQGFTTIHGYLISLLKGTTIQVF